MGGAADARFRHRVFAFGDLSASAPDDRIRRAITQFVLANHKAVARVCNLPRIGKKFRVETLPTSRSQRLDSGLVCITSFRSSAFKPGFARAVRSGGLGNFGCTVPRQGIEGLRFIALFALGMAFSQLV